ncbi:hypothetical protein [Arthrobacter sp. NEB 688]|uniref:hypothetical protein n=1 Tax=Arthrobacter sp. NEB 688 TaxID=904039 RepID=UPI0015667B19|nr:hypothetical protein [Arthrobacter sp. NEB 688]QKE84157.1 hypothetical protein HL663_09560 [Arthrobacter sp. NEB 688]
MDDSGREVVVRVQRGLRLLGTVLMGPLCAGILVAVLDAARAGDPGVPLGRSGWSGYVALGWAVSLVLLLVMAGSLLVLWRTEVRVGPWAVSRRTAFGRRETGLQDLRRVVLRGPSAHGPTGPRPAALVLVDKDGRTVAALRPTETGFPEALAVVRGWVERRPDLVTDEDTAALLGAVDAGPRA